MHSNELNPPPPATLEVIPWVDAICPWYTPLRPSIFPQPFRSREYIGLFIPCLGTFQAIFSSVCGQVLLLLSDWPMSIYAPLCDWSMSIYPASSIRSLHHPYAPSCGFFPSNGFFPPVSTRENDHTGENVPRHGINLLLLLIVWLNVG